MVLGSVMDYACETGVLVINPVKHVKWARPRALKTVDPRIVINIDQAQRLLAAIRSQGRWGERLVAFFACMYYAALRPEEVIGLRRSHLVSLPAQGWGEMRLTHSEPRSGSRWTDNGRSRERRELKHRAAGDTRSVLIHPDLAQLLRAHLDTFGTGRDGRIFVGPRGGTVAEWIYLDVYHQARKAAFTDTEAQSQLAETPYALRHAAVSTWLNAGVGAPQVAEWAGAQRGGTAAGLRQVHSRAARRGQAAHLAGNSTKHDGHQPVIIFGTTSAQPAAYVCQEPHTAAHVMAGHGRPSPAYEQVRPLYRC
jgi:integrase